MKSKLILCLAFVLSGGLFGCASAKFKVVSDKQRLMKNHQIVAEVTCSESTFRHYTTFRDQYFRIGAMPPHTRWTVIFRVNQILKGNFSEKTFTMVNANDAKLPYSHFVFEAGKNYTVGFSGTANPEVKNLAVFGHEPKLP